MSTDALAPGLMVIHGNHAEALRDLLVAWMKRHPLAPLENELVLVQSNGIAQWLKLALAADPADGGGGGCGIAAALEASLPARFVWQAYRAVLGAQAVPEVSPFDESRLLWRLLRLLPALVDAPVYAPLARFLDADADLRKRHQLAERLADVFDQYQMYRADWLAAWARGDDVLIDAHGARTPLPAAQRWQPALWRALIADVGPALADSGRAAVHTRFLAAMQTAPDERPAGLPRRVMVFGVSSLPAQALEVLAAIARWSQVLMCVHNPCEHYWADIVADQDLLRASHRRQARKPGMPALLADEALHLHAHPLLAAWGKQGRDFIGLLDEHDAADAHARYGARLAEIRQRIDLFAPHGEDTLLNQLQDDIRDLRPLGDTRARWPAVDPARDASMRFHVAHGAQREVEILHDQLLAAFDADPSLRPRDVIVMVPDIDAYAPHIEAVFGLLDAQDKRFIPFTVADRGLRHQDPLVGAIERLLGLPQSRLAVSDVLDLLEVPALRARFGIAETDLPLLHRWMAGANIRWGLDAAHRQSLELPDAPEQNSWAFGLRRMLLGYAVGAGGIEHGVQCDDGRGDAPGATVAGGEACARGRDTGEGAWQGIEPFDEVGGLEAAALGPLVALVERLGAAWRTLREPATVDAWCARLRALVADFFAPADSAEAYTLQRLETALQDWQDACTAAALDEPLPLAVVREHWLAQLDAPQLTQRFFAGAVTFATLMPMRAIPFRHVYLLGMNDGAYP
ncbi:MAG TPA: exodeoxyribonuclease V subunit gamma, partial [Rhodocyclaceae bacterium]|nr:exodeoxyribonuclease V subunit gamma [Rhodocyclaceae bacterium]